MASLARTVPKPFPTKFVHSPFGVQKIYTARGEAPSLRVDGMGWDGMDGMGWMGLAGAKSSSWGKV